MKTLIWVMVIIFAALIFQAGMEILETLASYKGAIR